MDSARPLGTQSECPYCAELIEWREMRNTHIDRSGEIQQRAIRYWSDCNCWTVACKRVAQRSEDAQDHAADYRTEQIMTDIRTYQDFTFATFDPRRLSNGDQLVRAGKRWLDLAGNAPFADRSYADPRCCLYFYSAGKGRGKTHLASAIALAARALEKQVSIVDEISYAEQYWAADLEQKRSLALAPGQKAWLTVFDDMGSRENTPAGLRDFWYDLIGPRWLKRGWTIITSNYTLDELVSRGTIDSRVYSRLVQMTGGKIVTFEGADQRLVTE